MPNQPSSRLGRLLLPILLLLFCGLVVFELTRMAPRQLGGSIGLTGPNARPNLALGSEDLRPANFLDGCYHVYLDVGTNVGIHIRKLYEPHLYPEAKMLPIFDLLFGQKRNLSEVCAVGFEPNPTHNQRLATLESSYQACSWPVRIFRRSAASDHNGMATFFSDRQPSHLEWGSGVIPSNNNVKLAFPDKPARLIRLSDLVLQSVAKRKLPRPAAVDQPPKVLMKLDIEGSEIEVISDLLVTGAFAHIHVSMVEWHTRLAGIAERVQASDILLKAFPILSKTTKLFDIADVMDETYFHSDFPMPKAGECGKVVHKTHS